MRAVTAPSPGGPEALTVVDLPDPEAGPGEVVIDVVASAVNRADTQQRQGNYPPPPGASDVLGLECSGRISAVGEGVEGWAVGDEVCALLAGGGYAEKVAVPAGQVMPLPPGVDLETAAVVPEVACTVWSNVFMLGDLQPGETLLVHGGAGGIGNFAIQLAVAMGARVLTTAGTAGEASSCASRLGAERAIDYHDEDFVEVVQELGGADVILDNMGAKYLSRNVSALATEGHLVVIGMQGGVKGELNLGALLGKRGSVSATSLRARPVEEKAAICRGRRRARLAADRRGQGAVVRARADPVHRGRPRPRADGGRQPQRQDPALGERWVGSRACPHPTTEQDSAPQEPGRPRDGHRPRRPARRRTRLRGREDDDEDAGERNLTGLVEQPAKVMRIGRMVQQLLEEVKAAPLDEAGRNRLAGVLHTSIDELKDGLAPELDAELDRLIEPFDEATPSESELRIAQAPAGRLAGGPLPRHPDGDLRPADGRRAPSSSRCAAPCRPGRCPTGVGGQHPRPGRRLPRARRQGGMYL